MRILSDFDGVWTDQRGEAAAIQAAFAREAAALMGVEEEDAAEEFRGFHRRTLEDPASHGWWPRGFLSAFVDEDELLATGAVGRWLDTDADLPGAERWLSAIRAGGHERAEDLVNESFGPAMRAYRDEGEHRLVPEAREVALGLAGRGIELVIVSNSPTEKLRSMFAAEGLEEGPLLRLVGDARKWWIEEPEPRRTFHGREVHLDRPRYREILGRERPDVVIGDVASLDLATPAFMRASGDLGDDLRLLLKGHGKASTWATSQVELAPEERLVDEVVPSISALLAL